MSNREKSILMIDSTTGNNYCMNLCSGLAEHCSNVTLITVRDRKPHPENSFNIKQWAPSKEQGKSRIVKTIFYACYLARLLHYIFIHRPDIVHFQFLRRERMETLLIALLHICKVHIVHTAHNVLPHESARGDRYFKSILYRCSTMIIAHSEYIKMMITRDFSMPADKITVIPHGNYSEYLPPEPMVREAAKASLGFPEKSKVLLFFGYIRRYKGVDLLISAFKEAAASRSDLRLVIAGAVHTSRLEKHYRHEIEQSGFADRILYRPEFISDKEVPTLFTAADIVMLPYRNIYHSGVVHMAYTFERPVITTRVGDFEETVTREQTGFVTEKNNADSLASTIRSALLNRDTLKEMEENAGRLSRTRFAWRTIARQTVHAYSEMLISESLILPENLRFHKG